jgi:FkbH-like protein/FkbM family methyltransferase
MNDFCPVNSKMAQLSFDVGIEAFPFLADHGFQDMVVFPGSFYFQLALSVHLGSLHAKATRISRVEFRTPVILSERNVTLSVEANRLDEETVGYSFHEAGGIGSGAAAATPCASLEIKSSGLHNSGPGATLPPLETFRAKAKYLGDRESFYHRLYANGNQYGSHFQSLRQIWLKDDELIARLSVSRKTAGTKSCHLDPILLDGVMHALAAFFLDYGRTFILQSVDEVTLLQPDLPDDLWVHARLRSKPDADLLVGEGDIGVFDGAGLCVLRLSGVRFAYMDRQESRGDDAKPKTGVVVASTFTAEPVEDSLLFWADQLRFPVHVSFAPYNQVFQELLSPSSQLRRNQAGINALLLNLGDWMPDDPAKELRLSPEKADAYFGGLPQHVLPNGLAIAHLNRHETEYVYQEIFEDHCYLRHGIHLPPDATVIDIGANIGLFTLFVRTQIPSASVYAFEPSPVTFRTLKANCEAYGPRLHPFNVGISDRRGSAALTFYDRSSVFSSFHPSPSEDRKAIQAVVANMVRSELRNTGESVDEYVSELMTDRLEGQVFECPLMTVSDIISENKLHCVDFLKVDAEKCELEILRGIEARHWPLIRQIVIEVHDPSREAVAQVQELLAGQGFQCAVEEENLLSGSGLFNVYGTRPEPDASKRGEQGLAASMIAGVQGKVDEFVQALQSFAQSAGVPTIICLCPPTGKRRHGGAIARELVACENQLIQTVAEYPNVEVIGSESILSRYQSSEFYDPDANELGHVPYTPEGFAAIGSSLFRKIVSLRRLPYKVIVLDCDNTLWRGACGEEGPTGVSVTAEHGELQQFMIGQMKAGLILCLCSKNNSEDVWEVFAKNSGMVLKPEHFATSRINWAAKSENLRSLARELNLGLESMIFLDDNPVECAEVRAECPDVLTLQLPTGPGQLTQFLEHAWVFDHGRLTQEDRTRTQKLLENVHREKYRGQASTLKDFIEGLGLKVDVSMAARDQIGRVSQLTIRTNQFNFTTIRRSESEIIRFLDQENGLCLTAKVSDRFGDYGMVGLVLYRDKGDVYDVDTFLLSCRVLGRGVEHEILAQFGSLALKEGKQWVTLHYQPSKKNLPAWEFIRRIGAKFMHQTDGVTLIKFPAANLAGLRYDPEVNLADSGPSRENVPEASSTAPGSTVAIASIGESHQFQRITEELNTAKAICFAAEAFRLRLAGGVGMATPDELPDTLAGNILRIWQRAIGNPRIGIHDNFVDVGGTSLKAVQIVAAIRRELKLELSIVSIFECPTVHLLCKKLQAGEAAAASPNEARERGARRKQRVQKRH